MLNELQLGKLELTNLCPKNLESIDPQQATLNYCSVTRAREDMEEANKITRFALLKFAFQIEQGKSIYDFV